MFAQLTSVFPTTKQCVQRKPAGVMVGVRTDDMCVMALFEPGSHTGSAVSAADKFVKALRRDRERLFINAIPTW